MSEAPSPNLTELLARVRGGDEAALVSLLQHYELPLRRAAHALLRPPLRAQFDTVDLVQSVHRALLPGLREGKYALEHTDQLLALALTAVRNKIVSKWRRAQSEQGVTQQAADDLAARAASRNNETDPAAALARDESVRRLLTSLAPADRQLVEWRLKGFTPTEIAERLGCDAHILRARLSRLRQRLVDLGAADWFEAE
jgi:RNA polymerase sigma-70 factor (ECF subfamily)